MPTDPPPVMSAAEYRQRMGLATKAAPKGARGHEEREVQRAIVDALSGPQWARRCFAFHVPNGGARHPLEAIALLRDGVRPGVADLPVMLPGGRVLWLEVKRADGSLRPSQREFRDVCESLGHPYHVVRSVAEALAAVEAELAKRATEPAY